MAATRTKALLVEDNPGDARLVREMLADANGSSGGFDVVCSDRLSEAIDKLAVNDTDVILLDLSLPDSQGLDTLMKLNTVTRTPPVVVLTGFDDEMAAVKAVHEGAQDYLVKGQFDSNLLIHSIRYAIERHRLRREIEETRQQQLEMKDRFLSRVSHELRTPLAAIYQFVTILLDGLAGKLNTEQREYLEITLRNTDQLTSMVSDLLEVTRAQTNRLKVNPQYVSLGTLVKEILKTTELASDKVISLINDVPDDLQPVYADPDRVRQIIVNLINNALHFTPDQGTITVRAEIYQAEIYQDDPDYLCISVADTGCGIKPEEQELVFDYLYQAENDINVSRRGLGLGLNICRELVTRQDGKIWVESEPGQGSIFHFTLPIFSLKRLLTPIINNIDPSIGQLALITVEASPIEKRELNKSDEAAIKEIANVINRCLPANGAQLLPAIPHPQLKQIYFTIAFSDQSEAETLFLQIEQQSANCQSLAEAGLDPVVSFTMLDIPSGKKKTPDHLLTEVINLIENQIQLELEKRREYYDQQEDTDC